MTSILPEMVMPGRLDETSMELNRQSLYSSEMLLMSSRFFTSACN